MRSQYSKILPIHKPQALVDTAFDVDISEGHWAW